MKLFGNVTVMNEEKILIFTMKSMKSLRLTEGVGQEQYKLSFHKHLIILKTSCPRISFRMIELCTRVTIAFPSKMIH